MKTNFDYYAFRFDNLREKINNEIEFYKNCKYADAPVIQNYIEYLNGRITNKPIFDAMIQYDKMGNRREIRKMNLDDYGKDIDIFIFKKPWEKLKPYHRIMKIREFINVLPYPRKITADAMNKNREHLQNEIIDGIKNKRFVKKRSNVSYNSDEMVIIGISCIVRNRKTGLYEIDWDL
jgi:uncharacterized protein (UPF0248 family)